MTKPSGVGRLKKSPVVDRLKKSPVVGRLKKGRFHPYAESKEKKSVEEGRAHARAQGKGSEWVDEKRLSWKCTAEEFEEILWKDVEMDAEMRADARRRNLKEEEELEKIISEEQSLNRNQKYPIDFTDFFNFDWEKPGLDLGGKLDWDLIHLEGTWCNDDLEEAPSSSSCDKTVLKEPVLDRIDSDDLPYSTEGKQISLGKHATVTERYSQGPRLIDCQGGTEAPSLH